MISREPSFSFGIEEEFYLVDRESRALASDPPAELMDELKAAIGGRFSEEYMRSQIEISTPICHSAIEARLALRGLRRQIADISGQYGLGPIASATHPFSQWRYQLHRDNERYNHIAKDFQGLGRRMLVCGLHVHIGIEDPDERIQVMNELRPYLPVVLALTTSSPFWAGEVTGLKSYRTAVNDSTPRKGIPERFKDWKDFEQSIDSLIASGVMEDATKIWWDLRPSVRFGTLEVRIMDVCPLVEDAICMASLLRCLCRYLWRHRGTTFEPCSLTVINENRWRAQRYGLSEGLIDWRTGAMIPVPELIEQILAAIRPDAEFFDCVEEVEQVRTILARGTSSDRQTDCYDALLYHGASHKAALAGVVDLLIAETVENNRGHSVTSGRGSRAVAREGYAGIVSG